MAAVLVCSGLFFHETKTALHLMQGMREMKNPIAGVFYYIRSFGFLAVLPVFSQ